MKRIVSYILTVKAVLQIVIHKVAIATPSIENHMVKDYKPRLQG